MTASGSRIAEIAERHVPMHGRRYTGEQTAFCTLDRQPWPCDASVLAAMLTPERLAEAVHRAFQHGLHGGKGADNDLGAAILVALEAQP